MLGLHSAALKKTRIRGEFGCNGVDRREERRASVASEFRRKYKKSEIEMHLWLGLI